MTRTMVLLISMALLLLVSGAQATPKFLPHKHGLTAAERVTYFQRSVRKDQTAIAWLKSSKAPRTLERPMVLRWYRAALRWHRQLLADAEGKVAPPTPPHYLAWLCIHRYEGSWTDTGAPFWGGLQMDWQFQATYGARLLASKGTADHWTPLEQMWVAERAYQSGRGFYPWPNTARMCGLI